MKKPLANLRDQHELHSLHRPDMEGDEEGRREGYAGPSHEYNSENNNKDNYKDTGQGSNQMNRNVNNDDWDESNQDDNNFDFEPTETDPEDNEDVNDYFDSRLRRRTLLKLDLILLPFLSLLFLLNSLDKSNIGNAETAGFTRDSGLARADVNYAMAWFFFFFVALQPLGAALGRRFGMRRYVPFCMSLWGLCTIGHCFVNGKRWQLVGLRIAIACLEAGFYPTTVSYLSCWYTRFEFGGRVGVFYGMTAVAGVVGGVLSWAVFRGFADEGGEEGDTNGGWKSWQLLFLIEGCLTMAVALLGFFWLPSSAETAWFLNDKERVWAERRIREDKESDGKSLVMANDEERAAFANYESEDIHQATFEREPEFESSHGLLDSYADAAHSSKRSHRDSAAILSTGDAATTQDNGLTRQDILSAISTPKIWALLVCNILSAIPATAFSVFLPMVIHQLSPRLSLTPAASNLLTAPPFAFGAITLFFFTRWSDRARIRLIPIVWSLGLLLIGLTLTVMSPMSNYVLRYMSLCVLLSGSFIASPLTVAWIANNTPVPGKRAILLGINGWGNLAGVFSSLLFTPQDAKSGYVRPFVVTFGCVLLSFAGFVGFRFVLVRENLWRETLVARWRVAEREREESTGDVELRDDVLNATMGRRFWRASRLSDVARRLGMDEIRRGDEKMTFRYGL